MGFSVDMVTKAIQEKGMYKIQVVEHVSRACLALLFTISYKLNAHLYMSHVYSGEENTDGILNALLANSVSKLVHLLSSVVRSVVHIGGRFYLMVFF